MTTRAKRTSRKARRLMALLVTTGVLVSGLVTSGSAGADPRHGAQLPADETAELPEFEGPESKNMRLVGNADNDGITNSDLAFWGDLAAAGNYNGFRMIDISNPRRPRVLSEYFCRGPQNDVSLYRAGKRLLLFQSVDLGQSKEGCDGTREGSSEDFLAHALFPDRTVAFEGIRMFDVTNPRRPKFLDAMPTTCGSHTHTLIPERNKKRLHLYISSYPLDLGPGYPETPVVPGPECTFPHRKISIVTVPFRSPLKWQVKEKALSEHTDPYPGVPEFQGCHDIQAFLKDDIAVAACAGEAQIWDISDPANPTSGDGEPHTHIRNPSDEDLFEFVHNAVITWDGRYFAITDESGGGGGPECDGSATEQGGESEHGFYYFYKMVKPGAPAPNLLSRYMIPRPQGEVACVSHNGNILPVDGAYLLTSAFYQGGNTVVDFTNVRKPKEIAYSDINDRRRGKTDSWSTYWYNNHIYASGGLERLGEKADRGLDIFRLLVNGRVQKGRRFHHMNPQTQEAFQATGGNWRDG